MNNLLCSLLFLICSFLLLGCKKVFKNSSKPNFSNYGENHNILETGKAMGDSLNVTPYMEMFIDHSEVENFSDSIVQQNKLWRKCEESINPGFFNQNGVCFFRITLRNTTPDEFKQLLCFSDFDLVKFDFFSENVALGGELAALKDWSYASDNHCVYVVLNGHQTKTYYIKCYKQSHVLEHPVKFFIRSEQNEQSYQSYEIKSRIADTAFLFFYLGFLFFCFVYFLSQFIYRLNEKILLIYSLYILFTLLYSFRDIDKHYFLKAAFPFFNGINIWGEVIFSYLSYIFYLLFVIYLLDLKRKRNWAYRLITSGIIIMTLLLFCDVILRLIGNEEMTVKIFIRARMLLFPFVILYFLLVMPFWRGYYKYFLYGSIFLLLGIGINLLVFLVRDSPSSILHEAISSKYGFWGNTVNYTRLGVIIEVLFFSLGLAKKMRMAFVEAAMREESAIESRFHTHEVKAGLTTLRSKLGNEEEATKYLNLFRDYLVKALELMKYKNGIELTKEIEMVREYFKLRQQDDERFQFHFTNKTEINPSDVFIPAALLIPFIQNFFDHAITDSTDNNKFDMILYKERKKINLAVLDNGPGIYNINIYDKTGSSGLDIARRKINLFNASLGTNLDFTIENNKEAKGTLVTIINLPKKL